MVLPDAPTEEPSSHVEADAPEPVAQRPSPSWSALWLVAGVLASALLWLSAWRAETGRGAVLRALAALVVLLACLSAFAWHVGWCARRRSDQQEVEELRAQLEALRLGAPSAAGAAPDMGHAPPPALGLPALPESAFAGAPPLPPGPASADGGLAAFHAFGQGRPVDGPISAALGPPPCQPAAPQPALLGSGSPAAMAAPASTSASTAGACAAELRQLLDQLAVTAGSDPWWGSRFWQAVAAMEARGSLDAAVKAALQSRGYIGVRTIGAPDVPSIKAMLLQFEAMGNAPFAGGFTSSGLAAVSNVDSWAHSLPPDFKRAGGEIYRNIRAAGSTSVRHWLQMQHTGSKQGAEWQHLWAMASMVDFAVGPCQSDTELYTRLNSDDQLELSLRHLSAHVYEQRTKDYVGGARLRAVVAPGSAVDIAPNWLISEATMHSKMEHQREERVHAELRRRAGRGGGSGKGDGKGKDKKTGRGS